MDINYTLWIHLIWFLIAYIALSNLVFKPYLKVYRERQSNTDGKLIASQKLIEKADLLSKEYENKVRLLNKEIKSIFEGRKAESLKKIDQVLTEASEKAQDKLNQTRIYLTEQTNVASKEMGHYVRELGKAMVNKIVGKDLT